MRLKNKPNFHPRGRLDGTITFICPNCGYINRLQVRPQTWKIRCKDVNCKRNYAHGIILWELPAGGQQKVPWDRIVPGSRDRDGLIDALPKVPLLPGWKSAGPVNRVVRRKSVRLLEMVKVWSKFYKWGRR